MHTTHEAKASSRKCHCVSEGYGRSRPLRTTLSKVGGKIQRIRYADNGNEVDCDLTDYAPFEGWDFLRNNFRLAVTRELALSDILTL